MPDMFNQFEFVFSAKDLASAPLKKMHGIVYETSKGVQKGLGGIAKGVEATQNAVVISAEQTNVKMKAQRIEALRGIEAMKKGIAPVFKGQEKAVIGFGDAFKHVFKELAEGPVRMLTDRGFTPLALKIGNAALSIEKSINSVAKVMTTAQIKKALAAFTFEEAFDGVTKLAKKGLPMLKQGALQAGGSINKIFQTALSLTKLGGKTGIMGMMLGPLGPLLNLLSPIINILSKVFTPLLEVIEIAVTNAFGPLQQVVEVIGQNLAPLITKAIAPLAEFLTVAAVQAGAFAVQFIQKLLPVFIKFADTVLPPVLKMLPTLLDAFEKLLPPLLQLSVVLLEKVFGPLFIKALEGTVILITKLVEISAPFITDIAKKVGDFFGDLDGWMTKFTGAFEPEIQMFKDLGKLLDELWDGFLIGIKPVIGFVESFISKIEKLFSLIGKETPKYSEAEGASAVAAGKGIDAQIAAKLAKGEDISALQAQKRKGGVPKMATGGVVTRTTLLTAGEEGPEAILPLTAASVSKALGPSIAEITLPGLDRVVSAITDLQKILRGTLSVRVQGEGEGAQTAPQARGAGRDDSDLDSGFEGIGVAAW